MIRKLLKVEFREAFSSMLPVGAGMLVLSALTALNSAITARIRVSSAGFDWLGALAPSKPKYYPMTDSE